MKHVFVRGPWQGRLAAFPEDIWEFRPMWGYPKYMGRYRARGHAGFYASLTDYYYAEPRLEVRLAKYKSKKFPPKASP